MLPTKCNSYHCSLTCFPRFIRCLQYARNRAFRESKTKTQIIMDTNDLSPSSLPRYYKIDTEFFAGYREHTLDILSTESIENHLHTAWSSIHVVSSQWNEHEYSLADLKQHLTFFWWHLFTVGMSTDSALDHQRLLQFMAIVKQVGYLPPNGTAPLASIEAQQGRLWVDLPFLQSTLVDTLNSTFRGQREKVPYRGLHEWRNLNMLAARISVCQVHDLRLCAALAMRDVLEEDIVVTPVMLEVVDMWLATYGYWLEEMASYTLVSQRHYLKPSDVSEGLTHDKKVVSIAPGLLAKKTGVDSEEVDLPRWRFWRSKLQSMAADDTASSAQAASALSRMVEL